MWIKYHYEYEYWYSYGCHYNQTFTFIFTLTHLNTCRIELLITSIHCANTRITPPFHTSDILTSLSPCHRETQVLPYFHRPHTPEPPTGFVGSGEKRFEMFLFLAAFLIQTTCTDVFVTASKHGWIFIASTSLTRILCNWEDYDCSD